MPNGAPESGQNMRELRRALLGADDRKIRQIVAMLDELPNPAVNQGILDPIRARVASLALRAHRQELVRCATSIALAAFARD